MQNIKFAEWFDTVNKIVIYNWSGRADRSKMFPYFHNQVINLDDGTMLHFEITKIVKHFFDNGLNVMLLHKENDVVVGVDTGHFSSR